MSSTFVADTTDDHKSDNTLIIIVNNDGTISVDQETLQNLLANQQNTAVSVVRVGGPSQGDDSSQDSNGTCDSQNDGNPHVNLTVEGFYPPTTPQTSTSEGPNETLVDPFLEMDPEQLERLETALHSEQAKQILGENVTAMLDMLSVEEEKAQLTDSIRMDHCYTNLSPSSAPTSSTPNHQYGPIGSSDTDNSDNSFEQDTPPQPVITPPAVATPPTRARGRGRGLGRPRRDATSVRSNQSYRGRGAGRGGNRSTRGGQSSSNAPPGMVMVQQIKPINPPLAPPPSSPSSASLVPLIKPLVMTTDRQQITTAITSSTPGQVTVQKQVVAVPISGGGTRLVTLSGGKVGHFVGGNQQRVLITNRTLQQQQQVHLQQKQQKQKQVLTNAGQDASNDESQLPGQDIASSSAIPGMTVAPGQAKVLVAKMPTIPPQLLGAQPSTGLTEAMNENKLPENEADFTHFPGREEENEDIDASDDESDDQDADDEEYVGPGVRRRGRFGVKFRGMNRRPTRGARTRGSGRTWERGSARGVGKTGVKRRGGRGRGQGRPDDIERAQRLEAEMAAALAAMDQSPEKEPVTKTVGSERVDPDKDTSKETGKLEGQVGNSDSEVVSPPGRKKTVKVYGRGAGKKKQTVSKEIESESEVSENKKTPEKLVTSPSPEKKAGVKSPVRKHSTESSHPPSSAPVTTPTNAEPPKIDRKNYPKRENRKPPAHLAEALGPALFSTPDIIRRVSTGSEQKTPTTPEAPSSEPKKVSTSSRSSVEGTTEAKLPETTATAPSQAGEDVQVPSLPEPEPTLGDDLGTDLQVPEDQGLLDTLNVEATKTEEELLADALLLQQHIVDDPTDTPDASKPMELDSKPEASSPNDKEVAPPAELESSAMKTSGRPAATTPVAVTRASRRRSSNVQESQPKKESVKAPTQKSQAKERRKSDENKSIQSKKRASRSRSSDMDAKDVVEDEEEEESEPESSDDESWNSEDDPDRLWCICKKPHNNRFMICCDSCEDWFHGKCVGVTKSIGKQMEENGLEWVCPNCTKKKETEGKDKDREVKKQNRATKEKTIKKPVPKEPVHKEKDSKDTSTTEEPVSTPLQKQQSRKTVIVPFLIYITSGAVK